MFEKLMESKKVYSSQDPGVRKGPWTLEEDMMLMNYIANHGEGVWNSLAIQAGLKRTGKSCRLRWLNYLRPDVRRGNITPEEQLLIMELHSKWGNRWSKIAKHLPGRTDNEIKNFWRTRIQKYMKPVQAVLVQSQSSRSSQLISDHTIVDSHIGATGSAIQTHILQPYDHQPNHHMVQAPNNNIQEECNESYWNMEDLWSMQLVNGN